MMDSEFEDKLADLIQEYRDKKVPLDTIISVLELNLYCLREEEAE
jgi:uncharacterized protein YbgA (DUF1722 family)